MFESRRPLKKHSQNFLTNPVIQEKIVQALQISAQDSVLEIGPGKGALSSHIIKSTPASYRAIEIDSRWVAHLKQLFGTKIDIIEEDFLTIPLSDFNQPGYSRIKVIGNLPYHITSPILFHLIDNYHVFKSAVLMVQKEVARRIVATPSAKDYGILSVVCQAYADVKYLFDVKPGNFFPAPSVDSGVFTLEFHKQIDGLKNETLFRRIVRATFNTRRKMLRNSLSRNFDKSIVYSLESIDLNRRPEELSVREFIQLSNELDLKLGQASNEHQL